MLINYKAMFLLLQSKMCILLYLVSPCIHKIFTHSTGKGFVILRFYYHFCRHPAIRGPMLGHSHISMTGSISFRQHVLITMIIWQHELEISYFNKKKKHRFFNEINKWTL